MVSTVGFGGCVVGGVYPDKGDLEEIFQVLGDGLLVIIGNLMSIICLVRGDWNQIRNKLH